MKQISRHLSLFILLCFSISLGMLAQNGNMKITEANQSEKRLALIIGNANYFGHRLSNPVNDAIDIAAKLETLGFEVIRQTDANMRVMVEKVEEFGQKAVESDVALFYYAGHGLSNDNCNYFIPVDAELKSAADVEYECINFNSVLHKMDESRCKIKILIVDSSCNELFTHTRGYSHDVPSIIPSISLGEGTIIVFSTLPGGVAMDGEGRNSPFAKALMKALDIPNLELMNLLKRVSKETYENAKQKPWITSTYFGDFYFNKK